VHPDVGGRKRPAACLWLLDGRTIDDDERLDRIDSRCRPRTDEDGAQVMRIFIRVIDIAFGPVVIEEAMRREMAVNDIRMPAVVIAARMDMLRRERQAHDTHQCQAADHSTGQAV
jgi:hypothetical protein